MASCHENILIVYLGGREGKMWFGHNANRDSVIECPVASGEEVVMAEGDRMLNPAQKPVKLLSFRHSLLTQFSTHHAIWQQMERPLRSI